MLKYLKPPEPESMGFEGFIQYLHAVHAANTQKRKGNKDDDHADTNKRIKISIKIISSHKKKKESNRNRFSSVPNTNDSWFLSFLICIAIYIGLLWISECWPRTVWFPSFEILHAEFAPHTWENRYELALQFESTLKPELVTIGTGQR